FLAKPAAPFRLGLLRWRRRWGCSWFIFLRRRFCCLCFDCLRFCSCWLRFGFGFFLFGLFLLWLLLNYLCHVDPFNKRHLSGIALTPAKLHNACVAAIALR